jgi:hypothetical protein
VDEVPKTPSTKVEKMVEIRVEVHEQELLEQWENAMYNRSVSIVG